MERIEFDSKLIEKYGVSGPRYTSYPTAVQFTDQFDENDYTKNARQSNEDLIPLPLSIYMHIPFCSNVCYYCACNKIITNNRARAKPYLENLHREIEMQSELFDTDRKVTQLHWGGGTPNFIDHDQMAELFDKVQQHFHLEREGEFSIEIDPREVKQGTIAWLRMLGFNRISLGVQDFNPEVQQAINRIQSYELTKSVIDEAKEHGFKSINVDLIYGLPKQTLDSVSNTLLEVIELQPDRIALYNYAHLPQLFKVQKQIDSNQIPSPIEKLKILQTAINLLTQSGYIYIGMDHFAKPGDELHMARDRGKLHRNFQGYSTQSECDLIGLGVTAISKIGDCYAQNVRKLDEYSDRIAAKHLPIARGISLSLDDRLRRDVIMNLICNFELEFENIEEEYELDFQNYFKRELAELSTLQQDNLIDLSSDSIHVLPKGRLLIRNVCMIFDNYQKNTVASFSRAI